MVRSGRQPVSAQHHSAQSLLHLAPIESLAVNDIFDIEPVAETVASRADQHQAERMASVPALYKTKHEQLACELALGMDDPEVVFARYGYTPAQALEFTETPAFEAMLARIGKEVRENGLSFRTKARVIAEELLPHAFQMATDPLTSSSTRATLIQWVTKVAGLEPKEAKDDGRSGGGLNLTIQFANAAPLKVVSQESTLIEQI